MTVSSIKSIEFRPMHDDVLLQFIDAADVDQSIIYTKESSSTQGSHYFEVVKVGPKVDLVKVGDVVIVPWSRMTDPFILDVDGKDVKFGVTAQDEILAIVFDDIEDI